MKTNNTLVNVYDSTAHSKSKLIHEHDFIRARLWKQIKSFLSSVSTAEHTTVTFVARLCIRNINTGGFTNEKI